MQYPKTWAAWRRCSHRLLGTAPPTASHQPTPEHDKLYHDFVVQRYTEPQRHYHTMRHLEDMLTKTEDYFAWHAALRRHPHWNPHPTTHSTAQPSPPTRHPAQPHDPSPVLPPPWLSRLVLEMSILFHDAVYDPTRSDNEEASAQLAQSFLREAVAPAVESVQCHEDEPLASGAHVAEIQTVLEARDAQMLLREIEARVCANIIATKHHLAVGPVQTWPRDATADAQRALQASEQPTDTQLLMDIDLAILGSGTWDDYQQYATHVRQEYSFYSDADFSAGRSQFLRHFLEKQQWFKTAFFFYRYESRAREYTTRELRALASSRGPTEPRSGKL